jgi:hypothetical protein
MKKIGVACGLLAIFAVGYAAESTRLLLAEDFAAPALDAKWKQAKGKWSVTSGVLTGSEMAADKHAAVVRYPLAFQDGVIEFSFRLDGAKGLHLSLNGEKGHICRVILRPDSIALQKDKSGAKDPSKPEALARLDTPIEPGKWHTLRVELAGGRMTATLDASKTLSGEHAALNAMKANFGFPVQGASASISKLRVWAGAR